jgi:cation diffusion facilitator family transporter
MSEESEGRRWVVYAALAANIGVCVAKFVAAGLSGSSSLFSEAIHSLADSGNELLLLLGIRRSKQPPDRQHPYGYGKVLYFWSLIVALVLFSLGGGTSIYQGVQRLLHPRPLHDKWSDYAVIALAFVFESTSLVIGIRNLRKKYPDGSLFNAMRRSKDPSVFTVVAEDLAAVAGLVAAFVGILLSDLLDAPWCDALGSIAVGLILALMAVFLASESARLLVGEAGSQGLIDDVRRLTGEEPSVKRVGDALSMQLGPDEVLLNLDVEFRPEISGLQIPDAIQRLEERIRKAHPEITRIFVEASSLRRPVVEPAE